MESRFGSSRPEPRPVVPIMTPLMCWWGFRRLISATTAGSLADKGSVAKA